MDCRRPSVMADLVGTLVTARQLGGVLLLAAKVRDFGSNLLKCTRGQMGTKPAKVGHLAPGAI